MERIDETDSCMDLVTIIVPVYNTEKYLKKCLESLRAQTYPNLEILLIDDGSQDRSSKICESYVETDPRMILVEREHAGVSEARNEGLQRATGDYVVFVDSDDFIHERFVEIMLEAVKKSRFCMASCIIKWLNKGAEKETEHVTGWRAVDIPIESYKYRSEYAKKTVTSVIFGRELISGMRFDRKLYVGEDTLFVAQAMNRSGGSCIVPKMLYYAVQHADSSIYTEDIRKQESEYAAWDAVLDLFSKESPQFLRQLHMSRALAFRNAFFRRCMCQERYGAAHERAHRRMKMEMTYIRYEQNAKYKLVYVLTCYFPKLMCVLYRKIKAWRGG